MYLSHTCRALEEEEVVASLTMFRAALQMEGGMREEVVAGLGSHREEGLEDEGEVVGLEKVRTFAVCCHPACSLTWGQVGAKW